MLAAIPLTVVSLILYNAIAFGLGGGGADPWASQILSIPMLSGTRWSLPLGDLMITVAILMLFFEVMKSARASAATIADHILSTLVLIAYVVEFIVVGAAANSVFFILTVIALFDVIAGFSISIKTATRDISIGRD